MRSTARTSLLLAAGVLGLASVTRSPGVRRERAPSNRERKLVEKYERRKGRRR